MLKNVPTSPLFLLHWCFQQWIPSPDLSTVTYHTRGITGEGNLPFTKVPCQPPRHIHLDNIIERTIFSFPIIIWTVESFFFEQVLLSGNPLIFHGISFATKSFFSFLFQQGYVATKVLSKHTCIIAKIDKRFFLDKPFPAPPRGHQVGWWMTVVRKQSICLWEVLVPDPQRGEKAPGAEDRFLSRALVFLNAPFSVYLFDA